MINKKKLFAHAKYVNQGIIQSFISSLSNDFINDVLHSTLFAQLVGNKSYSRFSQANDWYDSFNKSLGSLFWNNYIFKSEFYNPDNVFTLEDVIKRTLESQLVEASNISNLMNTIETFVNVQDNSKYKVFNDFSNLKNNICFQTSIIDNTCSHNVFVNFSTNDNFKYIFGNNYNPQKLITKIITIYTKNYLNEENYTEIRSSVTEKLGIRINENIVDI